MQVYQWVGATDLFRKTEEGEWQRCDEGGEWYDSQFSWDSELNDGFMVPVPGSDTHTPADLAMALELADLVDADNDDFFTFYHTDAHWLRAQVIAALYEGGQS